jgi:hypothetical protein
VKPRLTANDYRAMRWLAPLLLSLSLAPSLADAHDFSVADLAAAAETAHAELDLIEAQQRTGFLLIGREETERAYEEAVFAAMSGEHDEAAMGFMALRSLVDEPSLRRECAWYLADSLYNAGHVALAEETLRDVLDDPQSPFAPNASALLLRLYAEHRNPALFAPVYEDLDRRGLVTDDAALRYAVGRSWFLVGRREEARDALEGIAADAAMRLRADYVLAAIDVADGRLDDARSRLMDVAATSVDDDVAREIVDRARLGVARIDVERGDYWSAAEQYTLIGGDSPVLDEALFELVWTHIRRGDHDAALNAIDLFLIAFDEHPEAGRLELIRGHLLMKQARWGEASEVYAGVDDRSMTIEAGMRTLDIETLRRGLGMERVAGLPQWLWARFRAQDVVARASEIGAQLETVPDDLDEAAADAAMLTRVLSDATTLQRHRRVRSSTFVVIGQVVDRLHDVIELHVTRQGRGHRPPHRELGSKLYDLQLRSHALDQSEALRSGRAAVEPDLRALVRDTHALVAQATPDDVQLAHPDIERARKRLQEAADRGESVLDLIRDEERLVRLPLARQVEEIQADLATAKLESQRLDERSGAAWVNAAQEGRSAVLASIDGAILEARAGLADASWSRLVEIGDEKDALIVDRTEELARLEELFRNVRARQ